MATATPVARSTARTTSVETRLVEIRVELTAAFGRTPFIALGDASGELIRVDGVCMIGLLVTVARSGQSSGIRGLQAEDPSGLAALPSGVRVR